jgi:hypothetical protein
MCPDDSTVAELVAQLAPELERMEAAGIGPEEIMVAMLSLAASFARQARNCSGCYGMISDGAYLYASQNLPDVDECSICKMDKKTRDKWDERAERRVTIAGADTAS